MSEPEQTPGPLLGMSKAQPRRKMSWREMLVRLVNGPERLPSRPALPRPPAEVLARKTPVSSTQTEAQESSGRRRRTR